MTTNFGESFNLPISPNKYSPIISHFTVVELKNKDTKDQIRKIGSNRDHQHIIKYMFLTNRNLSLQSEGNRCTL